MLEALSAFWPHILTVLHLAVGVAASIHAVLNKRDERAVIGWVGVIWLAPLLGSLLYLLFGVNRIRRTAVVMRARPAPPVPRTEPAAGALPEQLAIFCGSECLHMEALARLMGDVTQRPLLPGNHVVPLFGGKEAYPSMLDAIRHARETVSLSTYIFDNDRSGRLFRDALADAVARGVQVRVLIDSVGSRYTWPTIIGPLRRAGVPTAKFNPTLLPWRARYSNLRNHRKIIVVDGRIGFTGGMNIREGNLLEPDVRHPIIDLHCRIEGPVVEHLQETFAVDWAYTTGETLQGEPWFPKLKEVGPALARGISDGPDDDFDKLRMTLLGALAAARKSVFIVTPYFLPDATLITAMNVAVLRGVEVHVVLPEVNNLTLVKWASTALLPQVLEYGCRVWLSPPPFDHTKLMLVDGIWTLLGSANWDPRSLSLNFEFNVECYDTHLTRSLEERARRQLLASQEVTAQGLAERNFFLRLRDNIARLASPYL